MTRLIPLLILLSVSHLAHEAKACSCGPPSSVYEEYQLAAAVFVGKAIASNDVQVSRSLDGRPVPFTERVFKFAVTEAFKGVTTSQIDVAAGEIKRSCYSGFGIGATYLVYAFRIGQSLSTGYCSRTTGLSHAATDLHHIRELLRGVAEPRVYGSVIRRETVVEGNDVVQRSTQLEGITILIEGEGKRFEAVTDRNGLFRFDQIPDGNYKARPLLSDGRYKTYLWAFEEFTLGAGKEPAISASDPRKAVAIDFHLGWNNELNGRILDAEGTPIMRANVVLLHASVPASNRFQHRGHQYQGKFSFDALTPGRYLLRVSINAPFEDKNRPTSFYYPNTADRDQAEPIEIGINETIEGKDIKLPSGYVVREIKGVTVWPDGKPAPRSSAVLSKSKDSEDGDDRFDASITDEQGRFSFQAFVGAEYWVHSSTFPTGKGEVIKIKVEMTNEPLKLVIPFPKEKQ